MSESKSLPAIIKETTAIVQALIEGEGEIPSDLELAQEINEAELAIKADQYGYVLDEIEIRREFLKSKIEALKTLDLKLENSADSIEDRLKWAMNLLKVKEINGNETRFVLQQNPPKVVIDNESAIPNIYYSIPVAKPQLDRKGLLEDLKNGIDVPGVRIERGTRISRKLSTSTKQVGA